MTTRERLVDWIRDYAPSLLPEDWARRPDAAKGSEKSTLDSLAHLPPGTLGYEYRRYFLDYQLDVPGEGNGVIPPWYAYHDVLHLLGNYPPTPKGELQVAAFSAGFARLGWVSVVKTLLMFQYGLPLVRGVPPALGAATYSDLRRAYERGTRVNTNLMKWNFREDFSVPVRELRSRFNIDPW